MGINLDKTCFHCENKKSTLSINSISIPNNVTIETIVLKNKDIKLPKNIFQLFKEENTENIKNSTNKNSRNIKLNYTLSNASTGNIINRKSIPQNKLNINSNEIIKYIPKNKESSYFILDKKNKFGIYKSLHNSISYIGYFDDDLKFYSFGNFRNYKNNISYIGEFRNNKANGYGIYNNSKNTTYEGFWENDIQNNIGIEIREDNSYYKGEFSKGKKNGIGSYYWNDKSFYIGNWENNFINGFGIYVFSNNKIYKGEFKNNQFEGYGEFIIDNNNIYIGYFFKDKKEGFGIFVWNFEKNFDKKIYLGFWKDNKMNGYGKIFHKNYFRFSLWKKGKKIKDFINYDDCLEHFFSDDYWNNDCHGFEKYKNLFNLNLNDVEKIIFNAVNDKNVEEFNKKSKKNISIKLNNYDNSSSDLFSSSNISFSQ